MSHLVSHPVMVACLLGISLQHAATGQQPFELPGVLERSRVQLPPSGPAATTVQGFSATVSASRQFNVGYVNVEVRLQTTGAAMARSRQLTLRLTPNEKHIPADRTLAAEIPIEFPQGEKQVNHSATFAKWTLGDTYHVEIQEDGVTLPEYEADVGVAFPMHASRTPYFVVQREIRHDMMFVDTQPSLARALKGSQLMSANDIVSWDRATLASLPTDWRLLSDVDSIVIPFESLLSTEHQDSIDVLRHWTMAGGTLVVSGESGDDEFEEVLAVRLPETNERPLLRQAIASANNVSQQELTQFEQWFADVEALKQIVANDPNKAVYSGAASRLNRPTPPSPEEIAATREYVNLLHAEKSAFDLAWRSGRVYRIGMGVLVLLPENAMNSSHAFRALQSLNGERASAMLRRGVDPIMGDRRHSRWLIPGVAQPPVYAFIGALTLFVILVGPVAYRLTTKAERSHLMFLIAPALAMTTTVALFGYSIVADGFGTRTRIRQITWIDGRSGDAFERTRATFFAGIAPRGGLQFPAGAEVMLYPDGGQREWLELPTAVTEVRWLVRADEDSQVFSPSILPARTQQQFVSHQIRPKIGTLSLAEIPESSNTKESSADPARLVSALPFKLETVIARSADGRYWTAENVSSMEAVEATPIPLGDTPKLLGDLYNLHRMLGTTRTSSSRRTNTGRRQEVWDLSVFVSRIVNQDNTSIKDGVLESWMEGRLFVAQEIPNGTFVAIGEPSEDVVAVSDAEVVDSVRYVIGTLK